jgi:hypothetical protein
MTEPENFLLRWARLKRGLGTEHDTGLTGDSSSPGSPETAQAGVEATTAQPATGSATDELFDLANLPSIESIGANTDIGAFLRSGVPAELMRAALRRAWESDPAIRDFVGIAENQWDFNDPDAIPGFGPLRATLNAPAALTQVSGKLENIRDAIAEMPTSVEADRSSVTAREPPTADQGAPSAPEEPRCADSGVSSQSNETREAVAKTEGVRTVEEYDGSRNFRRHGSALPH